MGELNSLVLAPEFPTGDPFRLRHHPAGFSCTKNTPLLPPQARDQVTSFTLESSSTLFLTVHFRVGPNRPLRIASAQPSSQLWRRGANTIGMKGAAIQCPCPLLSDILAQAYLRYLSDYLSLFSITLGAQRDRPVLLFISRIPAPSRAAHCRA